jgi:hypothetical protein
VEPLDAVAVPDTPDAVRSAARSYDALEAWVPYWQEERPDAAAERSWAELAPPEAQEHWGQRAGWPEAQPPLQAVAAELRREAA